MCITLSHLPKPPIFSIFPSVSSLIACISEYLPNLIAFDNIAPENKFFSRADTLWLEGALLIGLFGSLLSQLADLFLGHVVLLFEVGYYLARLTQMVHFSTVHRFCFALLHANIRKFFLVDQVFLFGAFDYA